MSTAALPTHRRDALRPRSADSAGTGVALSVLAHAGLVAALSLGVQWRSQEATVVQAELWASVPQVAAPPAQAEDDRAAPLPSPPPANRPPAAETAAPPREAEIAMARARAAQASQAEATRAALEKQRLKDEQARQALAEKARAREKAEKAAQAAKDKAEQAAREANQRKLDKAAEAKRVAAEEAREKKAREDQLRRLSAQLGGPTGAAQGQGAGNGAPGSTGQAVRSAGSSSNGDYAGRIVARIKPNIVLTDTVSGNPEAVVEVRVGPDGRILGRRLVQASGQSNWDEAVLRAVDRTDMVPRKPDGTVEPRLEIRFKPRD